MNTVMRCHYCGKCTISFLSCDSCGKGRPSTRTWNLDFFGQISQQLEVDLEEEDYLKGVPKQDQMCTATIGCYFCKRCMMAYLSCHSCRNKRPCICEFSALNDQSDNRSVEKLSSQKIAEPPNPNWCDLPLDEVKTYTG